MKRAATCATALALFTATAALAHKPSDSYLALTSGGQGSQITGRWDIALRDLDDAIGLDDDGDGKITWGELRAHEQQLMAYALPRLQVRRGGVACSAHPAGMQVEQHSDGAYAVLRFSLGCPSDADAISVSYSLLFDLDPSHRGLLRLVSPGGTQTAVFSPERSTQELRMSSASGLAQLATFVREGIFHIWTGFDHILFLLALLLPAVVRREQGRWVAVEGLKPALREVLKVVSMFTVAHSITLSLAALGYARLPSRLVESAIALSVILAALNNLWPILRGRQWAFAFGFGLIHGFGFASVLTDMGLPASGLARALFGFNLGVEVGQLAVVSAFLACAYLVRRTWLYQRVALAGGSIAIAALAGIWLVERAFELRFF